jgi:hypothetical protein
MVELQQQLLIFSVHHDYGLRHLVVPGSSTAPAAPTALMDESTLRTATVLSLDDEHQRAVEAHIVGGQRLAGLKVRLPEQSLASEIMQLKDAGLRQKVLQDQRRVNQNHVLHWVMHRFPLSTVPAGWSAGALARGIPDLLDCGPHKFVGAAVGSTLLELSTHHFHAVADGRGGTAGRC